MGAFSEYYFVRRNVSLEWNRGNPSRNWPPIHGARRCLCSGDVLYWSLSGWKKSAVLSGIDDLLNIDARSKILNVLTFTRVAVNVTSVIRLQQSRK